MRISKYVLNYPHNVEAIQYTGDNKQEVMKWANITIIPAYEDDMPVLLIQTKAGTEIARVGDYVIKHPNGDVHPYKKEYFEQDFSKQETLQ